MESRRLEKTTRIPKSNHQPVHTAPTIQLTASLSATLRFPLFLQSQRIMHGVLQHVKVGVCTQGSQPLVLQGSSVAALAAFCLPSQRHWVCLQMGPVGFLLPYKTGGKKKIKKKKEVILLQSAQCVIKIYYREKANKGMVGTSLLPVS